MRKIPLIVIAGPTASGKTALSVDIAKAVGGEIVSADSMQIYKYMNIGTAKPTEDEKQGIPHHMMDFLEPTVNFSVADYCQMAGEIIRDIDGRGKIPVIVGGTGLYIDSLVNGVDFGAEDGDAKIRAELMKLAEEQGNEAVHKILEEIDPETAQKYHPNNLRRIIRAIEVYKTQGKTVSEKEKEEKISPYNVAYFCIDWDREVLYDRINRRVDIMVEDGLIDEVKDLLSRDIDPKVTAMQSIGYKEFYGYLNGEITLDEALDTIKQSSRHYAKRQLTWFRRNKEIHWLSPENAFSEAMGVIKEKFGI
ncbi:MAG: tRNA (adenosine(37)-N6)-dimethylallyltransferase MiaA [Clostridia bacterium]|nr:tRNA (adenosine(37)-N6)-dimethylallyltransferase MiaA [Clostridia bacterium]